MNKFKFSNYKLPHMAPITFKKIVEEKLPEFDRTPKRLDVKKPVELKQTVSSSGGNDLNEFLKRIESRKITNPEYGDQKAQKQSKSYDFFITNRSEESDKVARQMDSLNKAVMDQAKNRRFDEMKKTRSYQQKLKDQYNLD